MTGRAMTLFFLALKDIQHRNEEGEDKGTHNQPNHTEDLDAAKDAEKYEQKGSCTLPFMMIGLSTLSTMLIPKTPIRASIIPALIWAVKNR